MTLAEFYTWLPLIFAGLMGLAMLVYAVLDGYDLGVGILMAAATDEQEDRMIASIGPFWDANETWLVLGIGLLLVAFPLAHGIILTTLYVPVMLMIFGLILRGVAFDFRAKAHTRHKDAWNNAFITGSALTAFSQGVMLGMYILGFSTEVPAVLFSLLTGICLMAGYCLIGACWLIMKTEDALQRRAIAWARSALWFSVAGIGAVSLATPMVSPRIFDKWFDWPKMLVMAPIPVLTGALILGIAAVLAQLPAPGDRRAHWPFLMTIGIYVLCFAGLAYSFYPYIVPERLEINEAASAPESLLIILAGALVVLPAMIGYTAYAYYVFRGKADDLRYD